MDFRHPRYYQLSLAFEGHRILVRLFVLIRVRYIIYIGLNAKVCEEHQVWGEGNYVPSASSVEPARFCCGPTLGG
jgi:hypothetical protein